MRGVLAACLMATWLSLARSWEECHHIDGDADGGRSDVLRAYLLSQDVVDEIAREIRKPRQPHQYPPLPIHERPQRNIRTGIVPIQMQRSSPCASYNYLSADYRYPWSPDELRAERISREGGYYGAVTLGAAAPAGPMGHDYYYSPEDARLPFTSYDHSQSHGLLQYQRVHDGSDAGPFYPQQPFNPHLSVPSSRAIQASSTDPDCEALGVYPYTVGESGGWEGPSLNQAKNYHPDPFQAQDQTDALPAPNIPGLAEPTGSPRMEPEMTLVTQAYYNPPHPTLQQPAELPTLQRITDLAPQQRIAQEVHALGLGTSPTEVIFEPHVHVVPNNFRDTLDMADQGLGLVPGNHLGHEWSEKSLVPIVQPLGNFVNPPGRLEGGPEQGLVLLSGQQVGLEPDMELRSGVNLVEPQMAPAWQTEPMIPSPPNYPPPDAFNQLMHQDRGNLELEYIQQRPRPPFT